MPTKNFESNYPQKEENAYEANIKQTSLEQVSELDEIHSGELKASMEKLQPLEKRIGNKGVQEIFFELPTSKANFVRAEVRRNVAAFLSLILWSSLLAAGAWHMYMVGAISRSLIRVQDADYSTEHYERAASLINETSKTIYAVLAPLATAATGIYFAGQPRNDE